MTEQITASAHAGYSPESLAWYAENFADTEWMVHVQGPDDCHTHANPDLDEDDPANPLFTEVTARKFAADVLAFNDWYHAQFPRESAPNLIPTVFHWGVPAPEPRQEIPGQQEIPAEPEAPRGFRVGDLVQITAREGENEATPPGLRLNGKTGVVTEIDDNPEYSIGVTVEGWLGLVWCNSGEIRHIEPCSECRGAGAQQVADPIDLEFESERECAACDGNGHLAAESGVAR